MKQIKFQKGITLVALIITIIVLLILAVVAIVAIKDGQIIMYAKKAANDYNDAKVKEENVLSDYESFLESNSPVKPVITWKENADRTFTSSDGVTVGIGDYVDYNEGIFTHKPDITKGAGTSKPTEDTSTGNVYYILKEGELKTKDVNWRVLGINDKGQLELISDIAPRVSLYLANAEGYLNAEDNLNNCCNELYGKGTNSDGKRVTTGGRSLNVEDINKLANYKPNSYVSSLNASYEEKWLYRYPTQKEMDEFTGKENSIRYMQSSRDNGITWNNIEDEDYQVFRLPGETRKIDKDNPGMEEITFTHYNYDITKEISVEDGYITSEKAEEISAMILNDGSEQYNLSQWLASKSIWDAFAPEESATFSVRYTMNGVSIGSYSLYVSNGMSNYGGYRVRPVAVLSTEVSLKGSGEDVGSFSNMWSIK